MLAILVEDGEKVVLEQVGGREAHAASIERLEDFVGVQLVCDRDNCARTACRSWIR